MKKSKKVMNYTIRVVISLPLIPFVFIIPVLNYLDDNCHAWSRSISRRASNLTHWLNKKFPVKDVGK